MSEPSFMLHVERVQAGCSVPRGLKLAPPASRIVLGRASDCDVVLDDVSVSRRHVELAAQGDGFAVRALSAGGSTFVDSRPLPGGEEARVSEQGAWLQLGRILLRVVLAPPTIPVHEPMELPAGGPSLAVDTLLVVASGKLPRLWLGGQPLAIFPSAGRVLARLCEAPGEVVTHDQLMDAVDPEHATRAGGASLAQLVTYIRDAFAEALDDGRVREDDLRAAILAAEPDLAGELAEGASGARRALLRALVSSHRGQGYSLRVPRSAVSFL